MPRKSSKKYPHAPQRPHEEGQLLKFKGKNGWAAREKCVVTNTGINIVTELLFEGKVTHTLRGIVGQQSIIELAKKYDAKKHVPKFAPKTRADGGTFKAQDDFYHTFFNPNAR